jgi:hypothetical protein
VDEQQLTDEELMEITMREQRTVDAPAQQPQKLSFLNRR